MCPRMKSARFDSPLAALKEAIRLHGTQAQLAAAIGKRQSYVSMLLHRMTNRSARIPEEICLPIETATAGRVRRRDLRPDLNWSVIQPRVRVPEQAAAA